MPHIILVKSKEHKTYIWSTPRSHLRSAGRSVGKTQKKKKKRTALSIHDWPLLSSTSSHFPLVSFNVKTCASFHILETSKQTSFSVTQYFPPAMFLTFLLLLTAHLFGRALYLHNPLFCFLSAWWCHTDFMMADSDLSSYQKIPPSFHFFLPSLAPLFLTSFITKYIFSDTALSTLRT